MNPKPFLGTLLGQPTIVRLKWGDTIEYRGILRAVDAYMNIQLTNAVEYIGGAEQGLLGDVMIRCNNILHIRSAQSQTHDRQQS